MFRVDRGKENELRALKTSKIEKNVSIDHTRHCIQTYNKNKKIHVRIHSTFKVIRTCIFILLAVLKVTQRVQPTCTTNTDFTYRFDPSHQATHRVHANAFLTTARQTCGDHVAFSCGGPAETSTNQRNRQPEKRKNRQTREIDRENNRALEVHQCGGRHTATFTIVKIRQRQGCPWHRQQSGSRRNQCPGWWGHDGGHVAGGGRGAFEGAHWHIGLLTW